MSDGQKRIALMSVRKDSGEAKPTTIQQKLQDVATMVCVPPDDLTHARARVLSEHGHRGQV
jgi:hypothetical protein